MTLTMRPATELGEARRDLMDRAAHVSVPTLGHYLECGFLDPAIRRLSGRHGVVGRAVPVRLPAADSTLLHHVVGELGPYDVLVLQCGDDRHAAVGEVIGHALTARNVRGVVIDGVCTDVQALRELSVSVHARGTSALTTKLLGSDDGSWNAPIVCGGVMVCADDIVLADENGVVVLPPDVLESVLPTALDDDAEEPTLVAQVRQGATLGSLTGASEAIRLLSPTAHA